MQLKSALRVITAEQAENLVVAYEPIWAIGSGKAATAADALEVCSLIRSKIGKIFTWKSPARCAFCMVAV